MSVSIAEILTIGKVIDEEKSIVNVFFEPHYMHVDIRLCVSSKDLFSNLSTQRNSIDRSIYTDVACIRYNLQAGNVDDSTWVPGKLNLANVLTRKDSALLEALQLALYKDLPTTSSKPFAGSNTNLKCLW